MTGRIITEGKWLDAAIKDKLHQLNIKMHAYVVNFHTEKMCNYDSFIYERSEWMPLMMFVLSFITSASQIQSRYDVFKIRSTADSMIGKCSIGHEYILSMK